MKKCTDCGEGLNGSKHRKDSIPKCDVCFRVYRKDYVLNYNYGISLKGYEEMFEEQDGKCAICESYEPNTKKGVFHVDHCHTTGKVRALLCHTCNIGLGAFQDDTSVLYKAMGYLLKHKE